MDPETTNLCASWKPRSAESRKRRAAAAWFIALLLLPAPLAAEPDLAIHVSGPGIQGLLQEPLAEGGQMQELAQEQGGDPGQGQEPAAAQALQPPPGGPLVSVSGLVTVHGAVHNAATGQPIPRVLVRIEGDAFAGALTDGDGRFEIPGVPPGPQSFRLLKPGFHDRLYASEWVGYLSDGPAHNVLVTAEMPDLEFALIPSCAIQGHIDLSTGDPAQGITVTLAKLVTRDGRAVWAQEGTARTNGDGAYRFASLPDGVYVVYTQPALQSEPAVSVVAAGSGANIAQAGYPSVFYPDARDFASAARLHLRPGEQVQANLSLTLEPFLSVTATAFFPNGRPFAPNSPAETGFDASFQAASVLDPSGHRLPYVAQYDAESRTLQASLPDGVYSLLLSVVTNEPGNAAGRSGRKPAGFAGYVEFSIAGHAVANLRIPLSPIPSWPIHLRAIRTTTATNQTGNGQGLSAQVTVSATDAGDVPPEGTGQSFIADPLGPDQLDLSGADIGPSWINTMVNPRTLCVDSFTAGGINLAREPLRVSLSAAPPPMELTLRDDCAKLTLELPQSLSAFLPGDEPFYTVYVVPDFDTTADMPPMTIHPSSGPTLTLEGLTPGNYHVYVFNRPLRLEYRNPAAMAALPRPGQAVTLSPGSTGNLVLEVGGR